MYCHMPDSAGSCLPAREGSDAVTCLAAPDHAFMLRRAPTLSRVPRLCILPPCSGWALALPHVPWLQIMTPCSRGLRHYHVSHDIRPHFPAQEDSDAATCPTALCVLQTSRIKKDLAGLPMRLGSRDFKACLHVAETPDTWATMTRKTCAHVAIVHRRSSWPLLDMATVVMWPDMTTQCHWPCSVQQCDKTELHTADDAQDIICYS
jgi:hypothetical protein